ncbi:immunoglobulin-like domain-containing protein [Listeria rocourtiae]|uniref:LPXTG cell wall anchor domain-containing protein n=1 Tax=Listeria rocourtiae TaxID=647910 RepID=UPI0011EA53E4|nr:immunoglobulin-like domain-containing protein [Listeria rocourtiae]
MNFRKEGNYPVVYSVTNSNGKSASTTVNMQITAEAPVIQAKDMSAVIGTKATEISWFADVTAQDRKDGDLSSNATVDYSNVNFQKAGNYPVTYSVVNSNGKSASTMINMQIIAEAPVISDTEEAKLLPKTGDTNQIWIVILGSILILCSNFIIRRKKKTKTNM